MPSSSEENELMLSITRKYKTNCISDDDKVAWIGLVRRNHVWYEFDENITIGESYSNFNSKSRFPNRDCAFMRQDGSWDYAGCLLYTSDAADE